MPSRSIEEIKQSLTEEGLPEDVALKAVHILMEKYGGQSLWVPRPDRKQEVVSMLKSSSEPISKIAEISGYSLRTIYRIQHEITKLPTMRSRR